ncbi:alkaline phosphatase PhoX [Herbidospora yilanensis]|uniref:alkaline phosphatase PhoX n=1 Tax=Herbidospora yilanensis TaxID=354426 RepID=UPI0007846D57|nr:alkaline phosphatase PhoX [Herbidospora yilanensis]
MSISRRQIFSGSAATAVGLAVGGVLPTLGATPASAASSTGTAGRPLRPFPPLKDDPNGILALPEGFSYKIVTREGQTDMSFGQGKTPGMHDGTGVVGMKHSGLTFILNHESAPHAVPHGVPHIPGTVYDPGAPNAGGCTVVTTDPNGNLTGQWVGISGTVRNCAGGVTPWGTWLTCEESSNRAGSTWSGGGQTGTYQKDHGYVFEVYPDPSGAQLPKPIKAFGRFDHEALAVEPKQRRVYLSEDASGPNGLFYRWTASQGRLEKGIADQLGDTEGTLEAMQIRLDDGSIVPDVAYITSAQLGRPFNVTWTPVPDRDAKTTPTRLQFADGTVTRGKKFEGVWSNGDGCYIVNSYAYATADLPPDAAKHDGMVWFYDYKDETITLVTYFPHNPFSEGEGVNPKYADMTFDGPDNVTVTPWGTLVLAEDGARASHVLSSIPGGPTYAIARNQLQIGTSNGAPTYSEFTGPTFSPDGKVLFVNIQTPGITLAITGPWQDYLR